MQFIKCVMISSQLNTQIVGQSCLNCRYLGSKQIKLPEFLLLKKIKISYSDHFASQRVRLKSRKTVAIFGTFIIQPCLGQADLYEV